MPDHTRFIRSIAGGISPCLRNDAAPDRLAIGSLPSTISPCMIQGTNVSEMTIVPLQAPSNEMLNAQN
jgi:hypothetical protein